MTAKESLDDKGHGFELGADDYLTKPFYLEELKMRIQALLKRSGKVNENTLSYGNVTVNLSTNSTLVEGKEVELLGKEFDLWFISFKIKMLSCQKHKSLIDFGDLIVIRLSRLLKCMFLRFVRS